MAVSSRDAVRDEALSYLRAGTSVGLRGLPGAGRSTLLRTIAEALEASGWQTVRLAGNPALVDRPLGALAIADLAAPRGQQAQLAGQRGAVGIATAASMLRRATAGGRTLLVVDDADVLDAASVGAIASALGGRAVPVLSSSSAARRSTVPSLAALISPGVELEVPPLSFDDSQELVQSVVQGPVATEVVSRMHARAGGMPGLVRAIAENALRQGLLVKRDGRVVAAPRLWTPHLERTIAPFLLGLDEASLDALIKLALVGSVDVDVAQRVAGWGPLETLDERGLATFVTTADSVVVTVFPPLLAEHLRREHVGARRIRLLRELDDEFAGEHPVMAVPPLTGDDERDVADAVINRLVFEKRTAELAVRRAEWEHRRDAASAIAYSLVLAVRGADLAEVDRVLQTELPPTDQRGRALLAIWRATHLVFGPGGLEAGLACLDAAEQPGADGADLGQWRRLIAANRAHLVLIRDRAPREDELLPVDPEPGDPLIRDFELMGRAEQLTVLGRPSEALAALDRVTSTLPAFVDTVAIYRGLALLVSSDLDAAENFARRSFEDGIARMDPAAMSAHGYALAVALLLRGEFGGLREHIGTMLSIGYTPLRYTPFLLGALVIATRSAANSGRALTARSLAQQAAALDLDLGPFPLMAAAHAQANAQLSEGALGPEAGDTLWSAFEAARDRGYLPAAAMLAVRSLEIQPDAARAAEFEASVAQAEPDSLPRVLARAASAHVSADPAEKIAVGRDLIARGFVGFGVELRAAALSALQAAGDAAAAAAEARELRGLAERFGASHADLIARVVPRGALTAREREIAELAASGIPNGEIARRLTLSVRTVENHLHRVFQKLDVDSRADLAHALANRA